MRIEPSTSFDAAWEVEGRTYLVQFQDIPTDERAGAATWSYHAVDADVLEVLAWAVDEAAGRVYRVGVYANDPTEPLWQSRGIVWVTGIDLNWSRPPLGSIADEVVRQSAYPNLAKWMVGHDDDATS